MNLTPSLDTAIVKLVEDFRDDLEDEVPRRLHLPQIADAGGAGGVGATGLEFDPRFLLFLSHPEKWGYEFIAAAAFDAIRDWCRKDHDESHLAAGATASLCRRLAIAVVELRQPIAFVAAAEDIDLHLAKRLLLDALTYAAEWREGRRKMAAARDMDMAASVNESLDDQLRREHDWPLREKVWARLRRRAVCTCGGSRRGHPLEPHSYMVEWKVERSRVEEQHRRVGCRVCVGVAA